MAPQTRAEICCVLAYALFLSPILVYAQEAAQRAQSESTTSLLSYVPADAVFAAIARPRLVLTHESMKMLPIEVISAAGKKELGIDPLDIESALIVAEPPVAGPPGWGIVLQMRDKSATLTMEPAPPYLFAEGGIIIAASTEEFGEKIQASRQAKILQAKIVPLAETLQRAAKLDFAATLDLARLRPLVQAAIAQAPPLPPPLEPLKQAPKLVSRIELDVRATEDPTAAITFVANNNADADRLETLVADALTASRTMFLQQLDDEMKSDDPVEVASRQYVTRVMDAMYSQIKPRRTESQLTFAAQGGQANQAAVAGVLVALLLPAVQAAREAARRAQAINLVKQLSLAMINYESTYSTYPARASFDAQGKPLLSWRVHILPFLEEEALYQKFRLDEPWDSDHNRKLIDQMPTAYANPNHPSLAKSGHTNFLVAVGPGTMFEGKEGMKVRKIKDGTSKTFLILEADADQAVIWTKPDDLKFAPADPRAGLGHLRAGGFIASRCDGSVAFYANDIDLGILSALFTCAGGEEEEPIPALRER